MLDFVHEPEDISELIVQKKKIDEVRSWLRNKINLDSKDKCLLITGPVGCGKSTTLRLLCDELDIACVEFDLESSFNFTKGPLNGDDTMFNDSQLGSFYKFIGMAQAKTIEKLTRTRKLILIRELPIMMINEPELLYTFLQETLPNLSAFLVFSLSQIDTVWKLSSNRLFSDEVLSKFRISHIKFNAIPKTFMAKMVQKWVDKLGGSTNKKFVNTVVDKAAGDLRSAMSLVDICCVSKRLVNSDFVCPNDTPIDLFHFLGKILYAKRLDKADKAWEAVEGLLDENVKPDYRRELPTKDDLSELSRSSTLSNSAMIDFLMEHEINFNRVVKRLSKVYEDVCQVLVASSPFEVQMNPEATEMNRQAIIRSMVFNNFRANENIQKVQYKFRKSGANKIARRCAVLRNELNSIYPSTGVVDTITYTIPLLSEVKSTISEEEACLCESINRNVKIDPKRKQFVQTSRLQFDIANDSD